MHSIDERLERIDRHADLGAFWRVGVQEPTADGPLSGRLVAFKDCFAVAGFERDSGVPFLHEHSAADAPSVRRHREAGATIVGKLAMHQLAWGMMGQTPGRPPVRNPHDPTRIPGGSSSGSAVALAAGLVDLAPGTDTGGSVRMPASACGIVGLKPTFGLVDKAGIHPNTITLDHCGPMARTVAECALGFDVLLGRDAARARTGAARGAPRRGARDLVLRRARRRRRAGVPRGASTRSAAPAPCSRHTDTGWQHDPNLLRDIYNCEPLPCYGDGVMADPSPYEPFIVQDVRDGLATPLRQYLETLYRLDEARRRAAARRGRTGTCWCRRPCRFRRRRSTAPT